MRSLLLLTLLATTSCSLLQPTYVPPEPWTTDSGLFISDLLLPKGEPVVSGQTVSVHYRASLQTGVKVDSSYDGGAPIEFTIGTGAVPVALDEGVLGMTLGARRIVVAPPEFAFGVDGIPGIIPPDSTITFDLEMMEVGPLPVPPRPEPTTKPGVLPSQFESE